MSRELSLNSRATFPTFLFIVHLWSVFLLTLTVVCFPQAAQARSEAVGELLDVRGQVTLQHPAPANSKTPPIKTPGSKAPGKKTHVGQTSGANPSGRAKSPVPASNLKFTSYGKEAQSGKQAELDQQIHAGDVLKVAEKASAQIYLYKDGSVYTLPAHSAVSVETTGVRQWPTGNMLTPESRRIGDGALRALRVQGTFEHKVLGGKARGGFTLFHAIDPAPVGWIRPTKQVRLGWKITAASGYDVKNAPQMKLTVQKYSNSQNPTNLLDGESLPLGTAEYTLSNKCDVDVLYFWRADGCGSPCVGQFRILPPEKFRELEQAEAEIAQMPVADANDSSQDVLRVQLYQHIGMWSEALQACRAAKEKNPDNRLLTKMEAAIQKEIKAITEEKGSAGEAAKGVSRAR